METGRILIVDEEAAFLRAIKNLLQRSGLRVDTAETAAEAAALLARGAYDGVITDVRLSPLDRQEGLAIARLAKSRKPSSKVILLTANRNTALEAELSELDVEACFEKPVPIELLRGALNGLLVSVDSSPEGEERRRK